MFTLWLPYCLKSTGLTSAPNFPHLNDIKGAFDEQIRPVDDSGEQGQTAQRAWMAVRWKIFQQPEAAG